MQNQNEKSSFHFGSYFAPHSHIQVTAVLLNLLLNSFKLQFGNRFAVYIAADSNCHCKLKSIVLALLCNLLDSNVEQVAYPALVGFSNILYFTSKVSSGAVLKEVFIYGMI
jgi:hypothetical protein